MFLEFFLINDTFFISDKCVKDLDSNFLSFLWYTSLSTLIQSNKENALKKTYFISSE